MSPTRRQADAPASSQAVAPAAVDGLTPSDELKDLSRRKLKPLEESSEAKAAKRESQQVRTFDERDLKKKAEHNTLRTNTHRRVERTRSSTATSAASSLTQSAVQVRTRVKFRNVTQTKAQQNTQFMERRPTRPMNRAQYVNTLKSTWGE